MLITGSGGIATNDYLVLKQDRIESFIYSETEGNIRYKEVRRTESGIATNGQQVTMALEYRPSGGSWISGGSSTVSINQFNTHGLQVHNRTIITTGHASAASAIAAAVSEHHSFARWEQDAYTNSHWGEAENALAHVRFQTFHEEVHQKVGSEA